jgi:hypothetical protein
MLSRIMLNLWILELQQTKSKFIQSDNILRVTNKTLYIKNL